jgi:NDP-sugar pyrophosphorylase family protein
MLERVLGSKRNVVVNLNHLPDTVISNLELEGRAEVLMEEPEAFGTAGTLGVLRDRVEDRIVVANGDVLADVDVDELLDLHLASGAEATVVVAPVDEMADFAIDADDNISGFVDRRRRSTSAGARFIGVSVFERAVLQDLPETRPLGLGESLLRPLAESGRLNAFFHPGYFADVGTVSRYVDTCEDVLAGLAPPPPPGPYRRFAGRTIEVDGGRAFVADSARCDDSSLGPGATVCAAAEVEGGALVRRAVIWPDEVVPAGTQVVERVWFRGTQVSAQ